MAPLLNNISEKNSETSKVEKSSMTKADELSHTQNSQTNIEFLSTIDKFPDLNNENYEQFSHPSDSNISISDLNAENNEVLSEYSKLNSSTSSFVSQDDKLLDESILLKDFNGYMTFGNKEEHDIKQMNSKNLNPTKHKLKHTQSSIKFNKDTIPRSIKFGTNHSRTNDQHGKIDSNKAKKTKKDISR